MNQVGLIEQDSEGHFSYLGRRLNRLRKILCESTYNIDLPSAPNVTHCQNLTSSNRCGWSRTPREEGLGGSLIPLK